MRPKCLLGNQQKGTHCLQQSEHYNKTGCINNTREAPKEDNIVIINKWNITQLAVHSLFMVFAFHRVN